MQRKHSLFIKKGKDKNVYTLFLGHLRGDDREIHNIVYNLHQAKSSDVLQIRISSSGGFVNHMLAIINVIYDKEIWKNFFDNFLSSYFSKDELQKIYNGEEYNFDACEMCRRGIATHIMAEGKRIDAKKFKSIGK